MLKHWMKHIDLKSHISRWFGSSLHAHGDSHPEHGDIEVAHQQVLKEKTGPPTIKIHSLALAKRAKTKGARNASLRQRQNTNRSAHARIHLPLFMRFWLMNVDDNPTIEGRAASRFLFLLLVSLWNMLSRVCMLMQVDIYCTASSQTGCLL